MDKTIALGFSVLGIFLGFIFDLSVILSDFSSEAKDQIVYLLSLCVINDVIAREALRNGLLPKLANKELLLANCARSLFIWCFGLSLVMAVVAEAATKIINVSGDASFPFVPFTCFFITSVANYFYIKFILDQKVGLANLKHPLQYLVVVLAFVFVGEGFSDWVFFAWATANLVYLMLALTLQSSDHGVGEGVEPKVVHSLLSSAVVNVGAGQSLRLFERTLLLTMPAGTLTAYYFAFRIFASLQQVIAVNVVSFELKNISSAGIASVIKKYKSLYFKFSLVVFVIVIVGYLILAETTVGDVFVADILGAENLELLKMALIVLAIFSLLLCPQMLLPKYVTCLYMVGRGWQWTLSMIGVTALVAVAMFFMSGFGVYAITLAVGFGVLANYSVAKQLAKAI